MTKRIKKHVEKALSSGFFAVTLVWGVAAFVVSMTPVSDSGEFRAYFPSGSSSSAVSPSSVSSETSSTSSVSSTDICSDGIDNDGDGLVDMADDDCDGMHSAADGTNGSSTGDTCADGLDNDSDGDVDMADLDCVVSYVEGGI